MSQENLQQLFTEFSDQLASTKTMEELEKIRVEYLGAKSRIRNFFKTLKQLPQEERSEQAKVANQLNLEMESAINNRKEYLTELTIQNQINSEWCDLSLPGIIPERGAVHPVRYVERLCIKALEQLGFNLFDGPEVETDYYNFDALNIPPHHPARDLQDTFWLEDNWLLRTHTTSVQIRVLEKKFKLPVKGFCAGRVYRNESIDATHLAMFHQMEGFWVDEGLTFAHLKGVTSFVARKLYGEGRRLRFIPKYYPYTEPSTGIDIECSICRGKGCVACHDTGWITIIGAGMIHPNVLKNVGYDPDKVSGIAFGWGTTRMATQFFGLSKLRPLYVGDLRLLRKLNRRAEV